MLEGYKQRHQKYYHGSLVATYLVDVNVDNASLVRSLLQSDSSYPVQINNAYNNVQALLYENTPENCHDDQKIFQGLGLSRQRFFDIKIQLYDSHHYLSAQLNCH